MDSKRVVSKIVKAFRKSDENYEEEFEKFPRRGTKWTKRVLEILSDTAENRYDVRHKSKRKGTHEWLWDLCWRQKGKSGFLEEVPLVAECEWHNGLNGIMEDFDKLLVARASVRIMVYDARRKGKLTAILIAQKLRNCVQEFNGKRGDTYLLIAAEGEQNFWKYFRITDQGMARKPKLERVSEQAKKNVTWRPV